MIREILFRGKRIDNGEWVYGDLVHTYLPDCTVKTIYIHYDAVDHTTIGQYTGLTDKNGTKIFEGDIIKWDAREWGSEFSEVVEWDYELFHIRISDWKEWCEVIGNIHDKEVE